ncbi:MAG: hypothetical protein ACJ77A_04695 [Actinomycetota bacterium]
MAGSGTSQPAPRPADATTTAPDRGAPPPSTGDGAEPAGPRRHAAASWAGRTAGWLRSTTRGQATVAFLAYLVASIGTFGAPILRHPGTTVVGWGTDPSFYAWAMAWFPHAIGHGLNPLVTHEVWAPVGFNLTHATAVPGPALALSPVTLLFGPVVAYNVMSLLAPVLAAWAAYLLCREVTGRFWASLVGGYLFGFSVYVTAQMLGHPNLSLVFPVPLCALVVLRLVRGEISTRKAVVGLAAALTGEFLISLEVFTTLAVVGILALVAAVLVMPRLRPALYGAGMAVALAYGITAVVVSPLVWSFFSSSYYAPVYDFYPALYASDLVNFLVPTSLTHVGAGTFFPVSTMFTGDISEQSAYFGLPLLAMAGGFAVEFWRRGWARWLLGLTAVVCVLSLGPKLHIGGQETMTMPWKLALSVPLLKYVLPGRLMLYAWLGVAVMAAAWLAARPGWGRWALAGLAVIVLFPNITGPFWHNPVHEPAFFSGGEYRRFLPRDANVLVVPYGASGESTLWQAESGFWFRMPGGNVATRPPSDFGNWPIMEALYSGQPIANSGVELKRFLGANAVRDVVVVHGTPGEWKALFAPIGRPRSIGGIDLYTVPGSILRAYANAPRPGP